MTNQNQPLAHRNAVPTVLSGTFSDGARASMLLEEASKRCHLISPATSCGPLPEGFGLGLSSVVVAIADTYDVGGGKRALGKSALEQIAAAAGVNWDPVRTRRLDDGRDSRYCMFIGVARVRAFDGSELEIQGTKEMDLRDGSPQVEILIAKARAKGRDHMTQLREIRQHIVGHAETKAKLRAIRSLGVRSSYAPADLAKPFVIAKLLFTGESDDPVLRRAFAMRRADAMLGGVRALYGDSARASMALPPRSEAPPTRVFAAPDPDDDDGELEPPPPATIAGAETADQLDDSVFRIPSGDEKGVPLALASTSVLNYYERRCTKDLEMGQARDEVRARAWLDACRAEIVGRGEPGGDAR